MIDPEKELEKIEEIIIGISKVIENETISYKSIDPCVKRNLVNSVSSDSNYKKSFDDYLEQIAGLISEQLEQKDKDSTEIGLQDILFEFVMIQDTDEEIPKENRKLIEICLIGSDYQKITELVKETLEK